ncbi:Mrp/NBP35 family ATP-binding protein [Pseudonocardia asaccharolytica]|uniref:Iron-sulfur cluster carrier protein n=1 Tax=Pseudonocardia asaccharolytica DSM 44247 = NBRC 16224 TaxID=1123024 RepID=A0A511D7R4_9PSEU|nr:Mrp/NBP35 family ATP-binding protein [Pseudonocardia asaccharolytica]GEL20657.1 iron-sulfur cluster carrier protein [Pseudonocardia asaccharolytica DSM 44247 = NBRC 16224]
MFPRIAARTSPDPQRVAAAVGEVIEPESGLSLDRLAAVGTVHDRGGRVRVPVALLATDYPLADELRAAVVAAATGVAGVREAVVEFAPMGQRDRVELGERLRAAAPPATATPRIYAVASGKGGVGKSTVTANLAVALAASGQRVGVLDADVWGYSIPQLFGVHRTPVALGGVMLPVQAHGVALISTGFFVADGTPVVWRGPMLHKALQQFLTDVAWGGLDVLLLDLPPGTGDITMSLLELVPDAALLAVTTPQAAARTVATRVGRMAREAGMPIAGVVENMSASVCAGCGEHTAVFGSGGGDQLAAEVDAPLLGQVPLDIELRAAGDRGRPVVLDSPAAASAVELTRIATALPAVRRSLLRRSLPLSVS